MIFDTSISRVHAYFKREDDTRCFVEDAASRNGTFVDNVRLAPKGPLVAVGPWIRVRFGSIETVFHSAAELYGLASGRS